MSFATAMVAPEKAVFRPVLPLAPVPGMTEMHVKNTYFEKLKDPRWQRKRLEALQAADWRCERCMDGESTLHVHPKQYFKGRDPWDYEVGQLSVVCEDCHRVEHETDDPLLVAASYVSLSGPIDREMAAAILLGMIGKPLPIDGEDSPSRWEKAQHFVGAMAMDLLVFGLNRKDFVDRIPSLDPSEAALVMANALLRHIGLPERASYIQATGYEEL